MESARYSYRPLTDHWKINLLQWIDQSYSHFCWTDGNNYKYPQGSFQTQLLAGNRELGEEEIWKTPNSKRAGIISYDFKNQIEKLKSTNPEFFSLPDLCFFEAEFELVLVEGQFRSSQPIPDWIWGNNPNRISNNLVSFSPQIDKATYLDRFAEIQQEIIEGNTYELNFCQAFEGVFEEFNPIDAYLELNRISPMPFSALFKANKKYLISASPERFIKKTGSQLIAQPIKGTAKRNPDPTIDQHNRERLKNSEKEKAENLMITDLMRNDLSKVSKTASVKVPELFGIYAFPKVFQMISTVSSELKPDISFEEIIKATFPMGSMTGAPKIKTMEIIEEKESFNRGWFSGALGIIEPNGDFDFSVIIRSIICDLSIKKLYFGVGSAITIDADAESEYEECLLKAEAIFKTLRGENYTPN
ncbi:anthranilate synthase component I family protein [Algoriphagus hitonicola]|uniref:Para-aminobenzoate synthetase component 1 n=1 Tax=Algoriphagus hitonicola TaxID=435880 RepID=A0A1I2TBL6_9BACT|nr:anthranilate synthase component I family protein [Algoriphagus hitonicola]SFG59701.1 para-aminobenzoate synthetase component 1 [Algoriphagus hitonicola]